MAYINADETRQIRNALKERYKGQLKFSVRNDNHSAVRVTIKSGTVDFSDLLDEQGRGSVNQYWLENTGEHQKMFEEMIKIIKTSSDNKWFDESDSMVDYFHTAFYFYIDIGDWQKPYELTA